jgi:hypothetical protein
MRIGFILGKFSDLVPDRSYYLPEFKDIPKKYNKNEMMGVDAAIAWYTKKHYDAEIILLDPLKLTDKKLLANDVNFVLGFDLLSALYSKKKGLYKNYLKYMKYKKYKVFPLWKLQNFIYEKGLYIKYLQDHGIPTAPTFLVNSKKETFSKQSITRILNKIQWSTFIIKPEGGFASDRVLKLNVDDKNLHGKVSKYLNENRRKFPRFIFQEAMKGFLKYPEIRVYWYGGKFAYAIGTIDSAPVPPRKTGEERVVRVSKDSLEECKKIGRRVLKLLPKTKYKGREIHPTIVRTDFGCCQGNTLNKLKYFVNEVELQASNYYGEFTNYPIVKNASKLFIKSAEEITGKKIKKL